MFEAILVTLKLFAFPLGQDIEFAFNCLVLTALINVFAADAVVGACFVPAVQQAKPR